ncbi:hypothetical protein OV090_33375 [Nannocystis sp. RBIL2]|uniref:hypothetical protein n=1 Tax=Nannocystis sp. RBIL2 TaxID=2996788 RepID=UPI002271C924|nr:hypothetical protein [Nannocystis sp. RBIL2]MCY1069681.1 hypothetical protein [Nannocystis sp. RBIL2]
MSGRRWLALAVLAGCINEDVRLYEVALTGEVVAPGASEGRVMLELHHASRGAGELATPLGRFDALELERPGAVAWETLVPIDDGEGLVLYAWLDVDGDGLLCGLDAAPEPAGLVELTEFPAHTLTFSLTLAAPCASPSALYPP